MKPINILHIVGIMNRGGIETLLMNLLRRIDKDTYKFIFLITRDQEGDYDNEIISLGGHIIRVKHIYELGYFKYKKKIDKIMKENHYDVVHCHMNTLSGFYLSIAKSNNIPIRIAHSHSSKNSFKDNGIIKTIIKQYLKHHIIDNATDFVACSYKAGKWLFGDFIAKNKVNIIWNGIEVKRFIFDIQKKDDLRKELKVDTNTFIIGNIGRMEYPKNQLFIIDVFNELYKVQKNTKLVIIGEGPYKAKIEKRIKYYGLENQVFLLGLRNDIHAFMSFFDVFIMPSHYEGFPLTAIEAQAASLPCIFSSNISEEVQIVKELVSFFPLKKSTKEWAIALKEKILFNRENIEGAAMLIEKGFDIDTTINTLINIYKKS